MSETNKVRALKDDEYRQTLSEAEKEALPENPAGASDLSDEQIADVGGASGGCSGSCGCGVKRAVR